MFVENLTGAAQHIFKRPEFKVLESYCSVSTQPSLQAPFYLHGDGRIVLGAPCLYDHALAPLFIRYALEVSLLTQDTQHTPEYMLNACLVAARVTARFWVMDAAQDSPVPEAWISAFASSLIPSRQQLNALVASFFPCMADAPPLSFLTEGVWTRCHEWLQHVWPLIGCVESLMTDGGDTRLAITPQTGLNHYGCSHRPRPWAVTFASSTASSLSERGFAAAEYFRIAFMRALIKEEQTEFLAHHADEMRHFLKTFFGLQNQTSVVLCASGTDAALAVLALSQMKSGKVKTILTEPDETGRGIPLAAQGCHFDNETSGGEFVKKLEMISGFKESEDTVTLSLRNKEGGLRPMDEVVLACHAAVVQAVASGQRVLLHVLDLSKTGLLAPDMQAMSELSAAYPDHLDIVVDACQARLMPQRIQAYLAKNWAVMVTGSKFYTGPPFCGALLLPAEWRNRLDHYSLPSGLAAYAYQNEWPLAAGCAGLAPGSNHGLLLRWTAARAEMEAFASVPASTIQTRLQYFLHEVTQAILLNADLQLVTPFVPQRDPLPHDWDRQQTILSFLVRAPEAADIDHPLDFERCRKMYYWLNADLSPYVPVEHKSLAELLCHIGQPVALPHPHAAGGKAGALRLSAGARLVSGEPSHKTLGVDVRMKRETEDARKVLEKISLILNFWSDIAAADPLPSYRPLSHKMYSALSDETGLASSSLAMGSS
ncbi:hypothetical protein [Acetobacter cibinongensis]|uniref:hypothetical protein n=1 Tax=Acetobacter cibinongensis TaxID=146475 RepID=UPI000A3B8DCD|nr:hypothetical protein [Acetobacter cibinongensis]